MRDKRVLFVTTHEPMFNQFVNRDMPSLGVNKDMFKSLDLVIYPNLPKKSAQFYYDNYDCIIFDEAHHCGAQLWGQTVEALRDLISLSADKVMIGATATGTRYLDNYMNVAETFFDNNVASKLTLPQAILDEILPAPLYINVMSSLLYDLDGIQKKIKRIGYKPELSPLVEETEKIKKTLNDEYDINKILKENNVRPGEKYVVFCSSIDELKTKRKEVSSWFKDIGDIEIYEAHSNLDKDYIQNQIEEFSKESKDKIKLMLAIDMFNEGMHISGVDGVIMNRRTSSPIIYLQQIGRALAFSARKKQIKIFDLVGNATNIDIIHNLYKELLYEASERLKENSGNQEHYKQIIDRFEIIEKGNTVVDRIKEIEELLSKKYVLRYQLDNCIALLEEYSLLHNNDFPHHIRSCRHPRASAYLHCINKCRHPLPVPLPDDMNCSRIPHSHHKSGSLYHNDSRRQSQSNVLIHCRHTAHPHLLPHERDHMHWTHTYHQLQNSHFRHHSDICPACPPNGFLCHTHIRHCRLLRLQNKRFVQGRPMHPYYSQIHIDSQQLRHPCTHEKYHRNIQVYMHLHLQDNFSA